MKIKSAYSYRKQLDFIHFDKTRFKVIVAHRRAGKTVAAINQLIMDAVTNPALTNGKSPRYAYIAPTYTQAKGISWDYFKQYVDGFKEIFHSITYNEAELKIYIRLRSKENDPGNKYCVIIKLWGGENPDSIKGMYLHGCIIDEVGKMHARLWGEAVRPMLIDKQGWCIFIGTPQGKNQFYELYNRCTEEDNIDWKSWVLKASETKIINRTELMNTRRELTPAEYAQEMECDFSASSIVGAYYADQLKELESLNRISENVIHNPSNTVYTSWDLGVGDDTSIWFFQIEGDHVKFIDYFEDSNTQISYYADVLKSKNYIYEYAIIPHDSRNRNIVSGHTPEGVLNSLGFKTRYLEKTPIYGGIQAVHVLLRKASFNSKLCEVGLDHLRHYRCAYNEKLGISRQIPATSKHNHACLVGDTKITTKNGLVEIKDIKIGDEVLTPNGYRKVLNHFEYESNDIREITTKGSSIKCTSNHKIFTTKGLFFSDSIRYTDIIPTLKVYNICQNIGRLGKERGLGFRDYFSSLKMNRASTLMETNISLMENIIKATRYQHYKELFGRIIMEKFQKNITFITKMVTRKTMIYPILSAFHLKNIPYCMIHQKEEKPVGKASKKPGSSLRYGTVVKKVLSGTVNMQRKWGLEYIKELRKFVIAVVKNIYQKLVIKNFVLVIANKEVGINQESIQRYENARYVKKYLASINTLQHGLVAKNVQLKLQTTQKVYDIEVEEDHCYYANGLLVSNSDAMRYCAVGFPNTRSRNSLKPKQMKMKPVW